MVTEGRRHFQPLCQVLSQISLLVVDVLPLGPSKEIRIGFAVH